MAAYSSVPLRKEQGEEREEAHKEMLMPCFLFAFFLVDQQGSVNLCSSPAYVSIFRMGFLLLEA